MKVTRIQIPRERFTTLSAPKQDFFLLSGHMQNEISVIHKTFICCLNDGQNTPRSEVERLASGAQAMIFARILSGKLYEAWIAVKNSLYGLKLSTELEPKLHSDAGLALKRLKTYFSNTNTINSVRNFFAFHYTISALGANWEHAANENTVELILGGTIGNNLNLGAELAANAALLKSIDSSNSEEGLRIFFDEIQARASDFTVFFEGISIAILEELFGSTWSSQGRDDAVFPSQVLSAVSLPFFFIPEANL
jgi:hypothetical protein